jgi:DNA-binding MarR family transcriptional regulator
LDELNEQTDIGCQLHSMSNLLKRRMDSTIAALFPHTDNTISRTNGWILGYLLCHDDRDVFQKDIESAFSIRRSTVSKILQLMEEKDFIRRESVSYDARLKKLAITQKGREIYQVIKNEILETEKLLRQDISDEELAFFFRIMKKFKTNIE